MEKKVDEDPVKELMKSMEFGYPGGPNRAANLENPITSYSGGWKIKMQRCAAQLPYADVLLLDEPTGHLDVDNIKWLEDWLESFQGSIICTSHFSSFLDRMCTHIIDFQERKLKTFKGVKGTCLTQFVEKYPEKKAYFELSNDIMKFTFPEPGRQLPRIRRTRTWKRTWRPRSPNGTSSPLSSTTGFNGEDHQGEG